MKSSILRVTVTILAIAILSGGVAHARELTFGERVAAQEAIERVYYSHQTGTTKPFEEAVSREVLENKVRTYLKQSAALEQYWHTPITAEMLQRELTRIAQSTRFPDRLKEIYTALGNDSFLMQECLARPALVDHLVRGFFAGDERIHAAPRDEAESVRSRLAKGEMSPQADAPNRTVIQGRLEMAGTETTASRVPGIGGWPPLELPGMEGRQPVVATDAASGRVLSGIDGTKRTRPGSGAQRSEAPILTDDQDAYFVTAPLPAVGEEERTAVYTFPKVRWDSWWNFHQEEFEESAIAAVASDSARVETALASRQGASLDCIPGDTWSNGSLDPQLPDSRFRPVSVWTGSVMVVWGGANRFGSLSTGGRYDPLTDRWMPMSTEGAPAGRAFATAVWTGREMIVWGGDAGAGVPLGTGARYDPLRDVWTSVSTFGAPSPRFYHTAVWTGDRMIVWGGSVYSDLTTSTGGRYDPATDTWVGTSVVLAPQDRTLHTAFWTGSEMLIWGGTTRSGLYQGWPAAGGRYNPSTDTWQSMSTENVAAPRQQFGAVWTGSEMLVWGGLSSCVPVPNSPGFYQCRDEPVGGRYNPTLDRWQPMTTTGQPYPRSNLTPIWTGEMMLLWNGNGDDFRYDPAADRWTPMSHTNSPAARTGHTAVWTGSLMIVWGGTFGLDGGRYDPHSDTWTPTYIPSNIMPLTKNAAVWTGSEMLVWGGFDTYFLYPRQTGSRYDPLLDAWTPISIVNAPSSRGYHSAIWTGNVMIIWGGDDFWSSPYWGMDTGGRYDPRTNSWSATSTVGGPGRRVNPSVIWTGSSMIVWGGSSGGYYSDSGGRYDPSTDRWAPVSAVNAPAARAGHSAVWTGTEMVVWGGTSPNGYTLIELTSGGRYDPTLDRWTPTAMPNGLGGRHNHSAVWTGNKMLVWGGLVGSTAVSSGARYDPGLDSWQAMTSSGAPSARFGPTAIWTGKDLVVWGGQVGLQPLNTGGRYDPSLDLWRSTSLVHVPEGRWDYTAVWTGEMMLVWGGPYRLLQASGGRYFPDPAGPQVAADAGDDRVVECSGLEGATVTLSGEGGSCGDPASLAYSWSGPFSEAGGTVSGAAPTVNLPLGTSTLTLRVDDGQEHIATDIMSVTVRDTTAPRLTCPSVGPAECSSPDGTPVSISPALVSDICDPHPIVANSLGRGGADASGIYPLGQTEVATTVTDASGNQSSCSFPVIVHDTTPPQISSAVSPSILWPPNHRMVDVGASVVAVDACSTPAVVLSSVTSSEGDDTPGGGDGNTTGDIQGVQTGTANFGFQLRAERDGAGDGRTYKVNYTASDGSGNQSSTSSIILVPHDQGGGSEPLLVSALDDTSGMLLQWQPVPGANSYKAIRGIVGSLREAGDFIDLGTVVCIRAGSSSTSTLAEEDSEIPPLGGAFFYLVSYNNGQDSGYGSDTATKPRVKTGGGCE